VDPEAARIVFESGVHIVMIPLEVSHTVLVKPDFLKKIDSLNSPFGRVVKDLLLYFTESYQQLFGFEYPPLHDPLAVAYLIDPDLFETKKMRVDIETKRYFSRSLSNELFNSEFSNGRTVCDVFNMSNKSKNAVHLHLISTEVQRKSVRR
jgi:inosine-uridine nucleoside N-ribohydrolase